MEEAFSNIIIMEYRINVTACDSFHRVTVHRTTSKNESQLSFQWRRIHTGVDLEAAHVVSQRKTKSNAGTWVVVSMSSKTNGLTRIQIMPYWLTTAHWQAQYAMEVNCPTIESIQAVRATSTKDKLLHYCPLWTAARKKGRPKENKSEKSVVDHIAELEKK